MHADKIIEQREAGLISDREARDGLTTLVNQSLFNANYSDTLPSYKRWIAERNAALRALDKVRTGACDPYAILAGDHASLRDAGDTSPDMGISVGDLARDAKDPHDIRS